MTQLAKVASSGLSTTKPSNLDGTHKALVFLVSIEEGVATRILSQLSEEEIRRLRRVTETLREVSASDIVSVHGEFLDRVQSGVPKSLKGSGAYLRRLTGRALGEGKASELWGDRNEPDGPVAALSALDVPTILGLLEPEHPQTIAVVLSMFEPTRAADLIQQMDPAQQAEIVLRMARLTSVPEQVIEDIERQFAAELATLGDGRSRTVRGVDAVAGMVKRLDRDVADALIEKLAAVDEAAATQVRKALFTFEDLVRVEGRGMQLLLKEVPSDQLVLALKTASEELKEKIFGSMSSRASAVLREELELLGPVRLADVETAQQTILELTMNLEREGKVQIAREGGSDFV